MNLSSILPYLLHEFKSDSDLIKAIDEISTKFTIERHKIGDYLKNPRLVSAYTAFYLLTNIPKLEAVLKWMPQDWVAELKKSDFIDLGAGPGTFSLAWKELGGEWGFLSDRTLGPYERAGTKNLGRLSLSKTSAGISLGLENRETKVSSFWSRRQ
jgi:hypothetical protein